MILGVILMLVSRPYFKDSSRASPKPRRRGCSTDAPDRTIPARRRLLSRGRRFSGGREPRRRDAHGGARIDPCGGEPRERRSPTRAAPSGRGRALLAEQLEERLGRERLGAEHAGALPDARVEQLERDDRVDRRLPDDRLASVLAHRRLVVDDVVEVGRAGLPSLPVPVTQVPAHVRPLIRSPSVAGSGSAAATTSRGETWTPRT